MKTPAADSLRRCVWPAVWLMIFTGAAACRAEVGVSNLDSTLNGGYRVRWEDPWGDDRAQSFTTGTDSVLLNSITLSMHNTGSIDGGGFQVRLFSDAAGLPGSHLLTLSGDDSPNETSLYTYFAPSAFTLSASTTYWVVATVPHTSPDSAYNWTFSMFPAGTTGMPGWSLGPPALRSAYYTIESGWSTTSGYLRMLIDVSPIPEAGTTGLLVAGVLAGAWRRTRQRTSLD